MCFLFSGSFDCARAPRKKLAPVNRASRSLRSSFACASDGFFIALKRRAQLRASIALVDRCAPPRIRQCLVGGVGCVTHLKKKLRKRDSSQHKLRVGLLGGSFNPAHEGHLHISEIALKKLKLAQVWWLVSPQNPLKTSDDMMDFTLRLDHAQAVASGNPRIRVSGIEMELNTRYTADTLLRLKQKFPQYEFYWLMGADNLIQLPRWKKWEEILKLVSIHVFDRDEFFYKAIQGVAYLRHKDRIKYHIIRKSPVSATDIRKSRKPLTS